MKIHSCRPGRYVMAVLDMHNGLHTSPELPNAEAVRQWMKKSNPDGFFVTDAEWRQIVTAVEEHSYVRVETEFDCDIILYRGGK